MFQFSSNQKAFTFVSVALTTLFQIFMMHFISNQLWTSLVLLAIGFGVAMFLNGLWFGSRDHAAKTRVDLTFRYHALTYFSVNGVSLLFLAVQGFGLVFSHQGLAGQIIAWGLGLLIHYQLSKRTIKGYDPEEIF